MMSVFLIAFGLVFIIASFSGFFLGRRDIALKIRDEYVARRSRWPVWRRVLIPNLRLYPRSLDDSLTVTFLRVRMVATFIVGVIALVAGVVIAVD